MKILSLKAAKQPCILSPKTPNQAETIQCYTCTLTQPKSNKWERLHINRTVHEGINKDSRLSWFTTKPAVKIGSKWREYQGIHNWAGLLEPLDDNLRNEILRYGRFVEAAYESFDFDPSSPSYATCRFPKSSFLQRSGFPDSGYKITKNLRATSGINLPRWIKKAPSWVGAHSSWIGFVAVCQDEEEISRLGRRDIVIAYRGTATCLEWLENLRATLTHVTGLCPCLDPAHGLGEPMVESGFLSLYSSGTHILPSLQNMLREEIFRLLESYGNEPLSITITGHSLGAALATLTAYDIKTTFKRAPHVTVMSFGGPRVGNRSFRNHIERQGTKILRVVNSDDLITKVPGFVLDSMADEVAGGLPRWIKKRVADTRWVYSEIGQELRLSSKDSPYLNRINVATCHELKTYLHLVDNYVSARCPIKASSKRLLGDLISIKHLKDRI